MMYRLAAQVNPARGVPAISASQANLQIAFSAIGIGCFVAVLVLIREPRVLQRYTYTLGAVGILLLGMPALLPASISEVNGAKIQIRFGSFSRSSRGSSPSWRWPSSSPATWWPSGTCWRWPAAGCSASTCRGPATSARSCIAWAASLLHPGLRERHRHAARCSSACSSRCSTSPPSAPRGCCIGFLLFVVGAFAASKLFGHVQRAVRHLAAPVHRQPT